MNKYRRLAAFVLLSAASLPALAGRISIATGGVYGGSQQSKVYCYVFNATSARVFFIDSAELLKEDGANVTTDATCRPGTPAPFGVLDPLRTCVISATAESGKSYSCRITVRQDQGGKPNIRGTLDIRDTLDKVLVSSPLR